VTIKKILLSCEDVDDFFRYLYKNSLPADSFEKARQVKMHIFELGCVVCANKYESFVDTIAEISNSSKISRN